VLEQHLHGMDSTTIAGTGQKHFNPAYA